MKRRIKAPSAIGGGVDQYSDPEDVRGLLNLTNVQALADQQNMPMPPGGDLPPSPTPLPPLPSPGPNMSEGGVDDVRKNQPIPDEYLKGLKSQFDEQSAQPNTDPLAFLPQMTQTEPGIALREGNVPAKSYEEGFQDWAKNLEWNKEFQKEHGEAPNLDDPNYDYRSAYDAGIEPQRYAPDDNRYHWPSNTAGGKELKSKDHPTYWKTQYQEKTGVNPDEMGVSQEKALKLLHQYEDVSDGDRAKEALLGLSNLGVLAGDEDSVIRENKIEDIASGQPQKEEATPQIQQQAQATPSTQTEVPVIPPEQEITETDVESYPQENLKTHPGAVEAGLKDPLIKKDLSRLSGMTDPIEPELMDKITAAENIFATREEDIQKQHKELNESDKALLDRVQSKTLTTMDKIGIGIAILIPILIAMRYGVGTGLAAVGKMGEAYYKNEATKQKGSADLKESNIKTRDALEQEQLRNAASKLELESKLKSQNPNPEAREYMHGIEPIIEPLSGKTSIPTNDEDGILFLDDAQTDISKKGVEETRKKVDDAKKDIGLMKDFDRVLDEFKAIAEMFPKNSRMWNAVKANYEWFTSGAGVIPAGMKFTIPRKNADGSITQVDAFAELKQKYMNVQDFYTKRILGNNRLTGSTTEHWGGILPDPSAMGTWMSQGRDSLVGGVLGLRDLLHSRINESLSSQGFVREPLEKKFPVRKLDLLTPGESVNEQVRGNTNAFKKKVVNSHG